MTKEASHLPTCVMYTAHLNVLCRDCLLPTFGFYWCAEAIVTMTSIVKVNIELGLAYSFRGSVHYLHGEEHGCMQADMVLQKELGVLHLAPKAPEGDCVPH